MNIKEKLINKKYREICFDLTANPPTTIDYLEELDELDGKFKEKVDLSKKENLHTVLVRGQVLEIAGNFLYKAVYQKQKEPELMEKITSSWEEAIEMFKLSVEHDKKCVYAYLGLTSLLARREKMEEGKYYFNELLKNLDPSFHPISKFSNIGSAIKEVEQKNSKKLSSTIHFCIGKAMFDREYESFGSFYPKTQNHPHIMDFFENSIKHNPNNADALALLGKLYIDSVSLDYIEKLGKAREMLEKAVKLGTDMPAELYLGRCLTEILEEERGLKILSSLDETHDFWPEANYEAGLVSLFNQRDPDQARFYFNKVLELYPNYFEVRRALSDVLLELGKEEDSLQEKEKILECKPDDLITLEAIAGYHMNRRDFQEALPYAISGLVVATNRYVEDLRKIFSMMLSDIMRNSKISKPKRYYEDMCREKDLELEEKANEAFLNNKYQYLKQQGKRPGVEHVDIHI